jgi:hypothetical protein
VKGDRVLATIRGANPGKWEWEKVGPVGDGLRIQVEAFFPKKKLVKDASDDYFKIVSPEIPSTVTRPTVKILSPNGGEIWMVGSKQTIKWIVETAAPAAVSGADVPQTFGGVSQIVKISLSRDGGTTWEILADKLGLLSSEWEWTVPDIVADKCRIRVTLLDELSAELCKDVSDADFRIRLSDVGTPSDVNPQH